MSTIQHLINGELLNDSGRTADVYNPSTGKVIHQVPLASRETIQQAIDAAKAAFPAWNPAAKSVDFGFSANSDANGYTLTASGASGKLSGCTLTLAHDGTTGDAGCLAGW